MASIYLRGRVWWICYMENGRKIDQSLKTKDRTVARYRKNETENKLAMGESPLLRKKATIQEVFDRFILTRGYSSKPATIAYYTDILNPFIKSLPIGTRVSSIKSETIEAYVNGRIEHQKIQPGMTWHILKALKTFFNFALREKYIFENPVQRKKPKLPRRTPEVLKPEEVQRCLAATEGRISHDMIYLALFIGARPAELMRLRWEDVDFGKELITIQQAKDGEFRKINLHPKALAHLRGIKQPDGPIFPGVNADWLVREGRWIKETAKVGHIKKFWYSLRHTFATTYYEKTRDLRGLQEILGHSKIEMTTVYVNPSEDHRREQLRKVAYD